MLLHRTLAAIFLFLVSAVWANSFTQVIAATYALAKIIAKDDQDVKEITLLTPLAAKVCYPSVRFNSITFDGGYQSIPDDIARLTVAFNNARLNNAGAKASDVNSTEEQLVDADSTVSFPTHIIYNPNLSNKDSAHLQSLKLHI